MNVMDAMLKSMRQGFTVVELVIVIVIIGILAGIAAVSYQSYKKDIAVSVVQSDLQAAATQIKNSTTWDNDTPKSIKPEYGGIDLVKSDGTTYRYTQIDKTPFCLEASSDKFDDPPSYIISEDNMSPRVGQCGALTIANSIGSDGVFRIEGSDYYDRVEVTIYDRWGTAKFTSANYRGENVSLGASGTYYYAVSTYKDGVVAKTYNGNAVYSS